MRNMIRVSLILLVVGGGAGISCGGGSKSGSSSHGGSGGSEGGTGGGSSSGGASASTGGSSTGGASGGDGGSDAGGSGGGGGDGTGGTSSGGSTGSGGVGGGSGGVGGGSGGAGGGSSETTGGAGGEGGQVIEPEVVDLSIEVDSATDRHAISPFIYGVNGDAKAASVGAKLVRIAPENPNSISAYNWEVNATNLGDFLEFNNAPLGSGSEAADAVSSVLDVADSNGGAAMLTVPMGDYVAADSTQTDVRDTTNYLTERFRQNLPVKGSAFSDPPATDDDYVYQDEFVDWVMNHAGSTPVVFGLDNHPGLWDLEHSLIHPDKASYYDVVNASVEYANAIKDAWAGAEVAGPVSYGWQSYVDLQFSPDFDSEGDFLEFYLSQMASAETDAGRRLLDYLDLEWWPDIYVGGVRITGEDAGPEVADSRMQAPRSLWDSDFVEDSWISTSVGGAIRLIPRMREEIDAVYPGTRLAFSAWYYGGGSDISGAIAAADVLGVFGVQGVDLAAASLPESAPYASAAFQAYLNYDGAGASFGDTSVAASTDDRIGSSAYASISSGDEAHLVIVAINKRRAARDTSVTIAGAASYQTCDVYELTSDAASLVKGKSATKEGDNAFSYEMPPLSVAVLVPQQ